MINSLRDLARSPHVATADHAAALQAELDTQVAALQAALDAPLLPMPITIPAATPTPPARPCSLCQRGTGCDGPC